MKSNVPPPSPGQDVIPYISNTNLWRSILRVVDAYNAGDLTRQKKQRDYYRGVTINVTNSLGRQIAKGELIQLTVNLTSAYPEMSEKYYPWFFASTPVWNSNMDFVLPAASAALPDDPIQLGLGTQALANVLVTNPNHRYAMIDPADPTQMRSADAGIYRLLADVEDGYAAVDLTDAYYNWQFKLTEDWPEGASQADAELLNWDGSTFSTTKVKIEDPLGMFRDMEQDDKGFCHHVGNKFFAYQAPCKIEEEGPVFPTP